MIVNSTESYFRRHQAQRAMDDADQAEFLALKDGSIVVDSGVYDERVAGALDDFDVREPAVGEEWHRDDLKYDTSVGEIHEQIERRADFLGSAYPFQLNRGTLEHSPSSRKSPIYEFLLSICNSNTLSSGSYVRLPRIFERISAKLIAAYFGEYANSIHVGAPRDREVGTSFKEAMQTISDRCGEWEWRPQPGLPQQGPPSGDEGCDFVVWLDAPDHRQTGQLFILGQCACGNNWQEKYSDLNLSKIRKWFNPLSTVPPVRSFATPYHVTDDLLREASRESGLFFDRMRLTQIAFQISPELFDSAMIQCMNELIDLVRR